MGITQGYISVIYQIGPEILRTAFLYPQLGPLGCTFVDFRNIPQIISAWSVVFPLISFSVTNSFANRLATMAVAGISSPNSYPCMTLTSRTTCSIYLYHDLYQVLWNISWGPWSKNPSQTFSTNDGLLEWRVTLFSCVCKLFRSVAIYWPVQTAIRVGCDVLAWWMNAEWDFFE